MNDDKRKLLDDNGYPVFETPEELFTWLEEEADGFSVVVYEPRCGFDARIVLGLMCICFVPAAAGIAWLFLGG